MNRHKLSPQAEQDLDDIWMYLSEQDDIRADRQIAQILDKLPMLAQYPQNCQNYAPIEEFRRFVRSLRLCYLVGLNSET